MGNVYGIANPWFQCVAYTPGGTTNCPAGSETTIMTTGALVAPFPGDYYPIVWGLAIVTLGATAPSALTISARITGGSDFDSLGIQPLFLTNGATIQIPFFLVGANSPTAWVSPGSTIDITLFPTGQAVTKAATGNRYLFGLFRGPDA